MTETTDTTEGRDLRSYRHEVRNGVSGFADEIGSILAGVPGLTQEQQVERFDQALGILSGDALSTVQSVATEGRDYAAERDFEAHQAAKAARRGRSEVRMPRTEVDDEG